MSDEFSKNMTKSYPKIWHRAAVAFYYGAL